jgi:hypothetical protein
MNNPHIINTFQKIVPEAHWHNIEYITITLHKKHKLHKMTFLPKSIRNKYHLNIFHANGQKTTYNISYKTKTILGPNLAYLNFVIRS